jgi:FHS family L-fucose permease-like MFS transporter
MGISTSSAGNLKVDDNAVLPDSTRRFALSVVTALFFMWGFITCLNDILSPHLKSVFDLSYLQSSLIQFTFFGAYFLVSIPAGNVIARTGYKLGMVLGLALCGIGALLFIPAANFLLYPFFLGALFVLASGITFLQVAANAYVSILGDPETASSRLNLAQAFNSLGTTIAPFFGASLILSSAIPGSAPDKLAEAALVKGPYLGIAITLFVLAFIIGSLQLPVIETGKDDEPVSMSSVFGVRHLMLGAIGIFLYVGAEVSIGSYLINFMGDPTIAGLSHENAAHYVAFYWGAAMVGRFCGAALLQKTQPNLLLAIFAAVATGLLALALLTTGSIAMWSVLAIGFFNSIMFPNIFTLGIHGLGHRTSMGSSLLIMAIVGGAIVPVIMGYGADTIGVHRSFIIPALCYLYIVYYGLSGWKPVPSQIA